MAGVVCEDDPEKHPDYEESSDHGFQEPGRAEIKGGSRKAEDEEANGGEEDSCRKPVRNEGLVSLRWFWEA